MSDPDGASRQAGIGTITRKGEVRIRRRISTLSGQRRRRARPACPARPCPSEISPHLQVIPSLPARQTLYFAIQAISGPRQGRGHRLSPRRQPRRTPIQRRAHRLKRFAAPACLSSPNRTGFWIAPTTRPIGFNLLGCPWRRRRQSRSCPAGSSTWESTDARHRIPGGVTTRLPR
jgi:hypothetical protein